MFHTLLATAHNVKSQYAQNSFYPDILTFTLYNSFMLSQFVVLYKLSP